MTAIYKRELKSYLTSMIGYVFIFFILLLEGISMDRITISDLEVFAFHGVLKEENSLGQKF